MANRLVATVALAVAAAASRAGAMPCTTPDALCTGDPCIVPAVTLDTPCILDFGPRTLVIGGATALPAGGVVDLTAAAIEVQGPMDGSGATGATLALTATAGPIRQYARISVAGSVQPGAVVLAASGDVDVGGIIASATSASAPGGLVSVSAGGVVRLGAASRVGARGGKDAAAGTVMLSGVAGAELAGHLETGGGVGGLVALASSGGSVTMGTDIRGKAAAGAGTAFSVTAGDTVTINRHMNGDGVGAGGTVLIAAPTIVVANQLSVKGKHGPGGSIRLEGGAVTVTGSLRAPGASAGGSVTVVSDTAQIAGRLDVRGKAGSGGAVLVQASTGDCAVGTALRAQPGGAIQVEAPAGDLHLSGRLLTGGTGCIGLSAGGVIDAAAATLDVPPVPSCGLVP